MSMMLQAMRKETDGKQFQVEFYHVKMSKKIFFFFLISGRNLY
jgi:hypothetical protein